MKNIFLYGLMLFLPFYAKGQEVLTLQQCREMALNNNKQMAAASKKTQGAQYLQKSFKANFFPNFTAYGTDAFASIDTHLNLPGGNLPVFLPNGQGGMSQSGFAFFPGIDLNLKIRNMLMAGIKLEQPIYMGGKIRAAYQMAKLGTEVSELNEHLTASDIILNTENAYALLVKAQEMKKVALSYNALLKELMKVVESAHKHGLKPQNDVLKVQVKLNESELSLRRADNACRLARMNLYHMIGKPLNEDLEIEAVYPHVAVQKTNVLPSISNRPEHQMLNKKVELAKQEVKLQRSELLPKIGIRGSFDYTNGLKLNDQKLFDSGGFAILLNVSIPVFHFGEHTHKVKAAKAKLEQAELEQADLNEKMTLELTQAANNLDEAHMEAALSDRSLEQAAENQRLSQKQYEAGLETLSDHLEAQALWQQAYATKVDAHFQLYLHYVKYLKAAGNLIK